MLFDILPSKALCKSTSNIYDIDITLYPVTLPRPSWWRSPTLYNHSRNTSNKLCITPHLSALGGATLILYYSGFFCLHHSLIIYQFTFNYLSGKL
ncbi:hypothetical protein [uncultured Tyzzerella sp.]|uniref:hypothetical protein n=1 Tax=uncultured Tyzzerella sp. TaxID=2321398 RepID=UPI002943364E|nr:hypothetical protein [uncultured Tyzzerella sp.]